MKPLIISVLLALSCAADTASWYGESHRGRLMANGKPFDPEAMTCASWFYPLGTRLDVTSGGRTVRVTVTDRGPAWRLVDDGRVIDLSRGAFRRIGRLKAGVIRVTIVPAHGG